MATLRCKDAFAADVAGVPRVVAAGQLVDSSDPIVKGRERFFEPVDMYMGRRSEKPPAQAETATAVPGERRTRTKGK